MTAKPHRFNWIVQGELAGMARPGMMNSFADDMDYLEASGIGHIITLQENALPAEWFSYTEIRPHHIPVDDFGIPSMKQADGFIKLMKDIVSDRNAAAVHCYAGMGRTGVFVALYWAARYGVDGAGAIRAVREISPEYIQTKEQEDFVSAWADQNQR